MSSNPEKSPIKELFKTPDDPNEIPKINLPELCREIVLTDGSLKEQPEIPDFVASKPDEEK